MQAGQPLCCFESNKINGKLIRPVVQEEMLFKDFSIFSSGDHFVPTAECIHFCNFSRGHYREHLCEIISTLGPVVKMFLKQKFQVNI